MKVLHAAHLPFWSGGVVQQMLWEQEAADVLGLDWHSRVFLAHNPGDARPATLPETVLVEHEPRQRWLDYRRAYYEWLTAAAPRYDLVLLRYSNFNPLQLRFLTSTKTPVLLVHHALEVPELRTLRWGGLKAFGEEILGRQALRSVAGIVAVTDEIARYERDRSGRAQLPSLLYPNGTVMPDETLVARHHPVPRFLFVASRFAPWQGLDKLIEAASRSNADFVIDLVGEVEATDAAACEADKRFVLHGTQDADYIKTLAEQAWVGLSSFGLQRMGMEEACTLKVREYLRAGLPVYADHRDVFPADFRFFRNERCDMDQIIAFAEECRAVPPEAVAAAARPYIEKKSLLSKLHGQILALDLPAPGRTR